MDQKHRKLPRNSPISKPYAIFGAGLSAQAARRLALAKGHPVVLFDEAGQGDRATFGEADVAQFECFIFSPGFAAAHPWRRLAEASGRPCRSEIAFAAPHWRGQLIGVTGTNGKSTLTALLQKAFQLSGRESVAAGNIGYPLADAVLSESNREGAVAVVEISSFQAELPDGLLLDALAWTNFAEDHLDRYPSMAHYFRAKAQLFECLKGKGVSVISSQVGEWMAKFRKGLDAFTPLEEPAPTTSELAPNSVFHRFPHSENFSRAAALWQRLGNPPEPLLEAGNAFTLAAHRLSVVAEFDGIRFWNDSKATNFHATLAALESVAAPIVWIGGGRSKGGDVEAFAQKVAEHVAVAVLYGEAAERLADALASSRVSADGVHVRDRFEDAVLAAAQLAAEIPHANVLLSPGFSSFDQFSSYEARGKSFVATVLSLKNPHNFS